MGNENQHSKEKKPRHRSPNYPAVGLREAVERLKKFYEADGKAGASDEVAVLHIGFASAHGQALSVLAALKKFGLVESVKDRIAPTQRAIEIIVLPENDPRRIQALRDAVVSPAIYRELIEQHRETGFPSDESLKSEMLAYKGFNPNAVDGFMKDFRDSLDFSRLSDSSELESEDMKGTTQEIPRESARHALGEPPLQPQGKRPQTLVNDWTLSPHASAELRINGDVNKEDLDLLRDYVEITIKALSRKAKPKRSE